MAIPIYTNGNGFYCEDCASEDGISSGHMTLLETDLELLHDGDYCCNCGRHNKGNEDAHRTGYATNEDFIFTD